MSISQACKNVLSFLSSFMHETCFMYSLRSQRAQMLHVQRLLGDSSSHKAFCSGFHLSSQMRKLLWQAVYIISFSTKAFQESRHFFSDNIILLVKGTHFPEKQLFSKSYWTLLGLGAM